MRSFQRLLVSILAVSLVVYGSPVEKELDQRGLSALVCAVVTGIIKEVKNDAKVTSHCSSFLKIPTSTVNRTGVTTATVFSTSTLTASVTVLITTFVPQETTVTTTETSTYTCIQPTYGPTFTTGPPQTVVITETITSSLCPTPTLTTVIKRDADGYVTADPLIWVEKRGREARATKKSGVEIIKSLQSKVASTVCGCLSITTPTTTSTSLSTSKTTKWTTVTTTTSVTATSTVPTITTITSTQTFVRVVPSYTFIPQYTVTVPAETVTETDTETQTIQCTFTVRATLPMLARSPVKVHARGDAKGAKPVLFSDKGSAFTLDAEGHLIDENQQVAIAESIPGRDAAPVQFKSLGSAKNESMLVCGSGERFLECNVGAQEQRLMVCLPKGEEHPAMYLAEENSEEDCLDGGFKVEVQEL